MTTATIRSMIGFLALTMMFVGATMLWGVGAGFFSVGLFVALAAVLEAWLEEQANMQ